MNHLKRILVLLILLIIAGIDTFAQSAVQITLKPLTIGDTLQAGIPLKLMNDGQEVLKVRDLRGKVVLLDFWEKYCPACISGLPKLQRLQDRFSGELQVIAVTSSPESEVREVLNRVDFLEKVNLPFAVEDSLLDEVFPHRIIPHIIWLDSHGVVKAITGGEEVTEANIQAMIDGREIILPLKKEPIIQVSTNFFGDARADSSLLMRSELRRAAIMNGRGHISLDQENGLPNGVFFRMKPIGMFYDIFSYTKIGFLGNLNCRRIINEVKDSLTFKRYANANLPIPYHPNKFPYMHYKTRDVFYKENILVYRLTLPQGVPDSLLLRYVLADLNRYFPIKGRVEKRKVPCWVVTAADSAAALLASNGGKPRNIYNSDSVGVINKPLDMFFYWIRHFRDAEPFIDETGIDFPVDLAVDFRDSPLRKPRNGYIGNNPLDRDMLKAALQRYGLNMKKEQREVDMLIIYD